MSKTEEKSREGEGGCVYTSARACFDNRWPRSLYTTNRVTRDMREMLVRSIWSSINFHPRVWWSTTTDWNFRGPTSGLSATAGRKRADVISQGKKEGEGEGERGPIFGFTRVYRWVYYRESVAHLRDVLSFRRDVEGRWREYVHTVLVNLSSVISSARARASPRQDTRIVSIHRLSVKWAKIIVWINHRPRHVVSLNVHLNCLPSSLIFVRLLFLLLLRFPIFFPKFLEFVKHCTKEQ